MNQQEILKQAKKIMDNFHSALKDVENLEESRVEREECERREGEKETGEKNDSEFWEIMMKNAPKTKNDCIEAEKGKWVE